MKNILNKKELGLPSLVSSHGSRGSLGTDGSDFLRVNSNFEGEARLINRDRLNRS